VRTCFKKIDRNGFSVVRWAFGLEPEVVAVHGPEGRSEGVRRPWK
jgi:hypothetical protein